MMTALTRRAFLKTTAAGLAGTVAPGLLLGAEPTSRTPRRGRVKILAVSDMHIVDESTTAYPRKVIQAMNEEGGDLVLVCGDLAKDGKRSELETAKRVLDELKMPYHPVLGNHDALYSGEKEETLFKEVFGLKQNSYHFVTNGVHFVGIDHGCGKSYGKNAVRPHVMAWLKQTLADIPDDEPIVFFSHYPFAKGVRYQTPNATELLTLFRGKTLLAMVGGHFHGNTEHRQDGVLMTTTACSSGTRGNHDGTKAKGYRVFHIDEQMNVTTEFKEVSP